VPFSRHIQVARGSAVCRRRATSRAPIGCGRPTNQRGPRPQEPLPSNRREPGLTGRHAALSGRRAGVGGSRAAARHYGSARRGARVLLTAPPGAGAEKYPRAAGMLQDSQLAQGLSRLSICSISKYESFPPKRLFFFLLKFLLSCCSPSRCC